MTLVSPVPGRAVRPVAGLAALPVLVILPPIVASPSTRHVAPALGVGLAARPIVSQFVRCGRPVGNTTTTASADGDPAREHDATPGLPPRPGRDEGRDTVPGRPRNADRGRYFLFLRWIRVLFSSLRCFFFAIRLRRFLMTEPIRPPSSSAQRQTGTPSRSPRTGGWAHARNSR